MNPFEIQLRAAVVGNLDAEIAAGRARVAYAAYWGMDDVSAALQGKWRTDFAASGLGRAAELSKTIRRKVYRNSGLNPAAVVYSTMPAVELAFEMGAPITAQNARGTLFPEPSVWGGRLRRPSGRGAKSVSTFQLGVRRFGPLQWIATPGHGKQVGVFVARLDRAHLAAGRHRKAGVRALRAKAFDTVVVFRVLKDARLPRLLRGDVIRARTERDFPALYQRAFDIRLDEASRGPALLTGPST